VSPLLESDRDRAGLRSINQALLLEGNSAPAYTWGAAFFWDIITGWVQVLRRGIPPYSFRGAGSVKNKQIDNELHCPQSGSAEQDESATIKAF
jgi:hypothetical protein